MTEHSTPERRAASQPPAVDRLVFSVRPARGTAAPEFDLTLDGLWRLADELVADLRQVSPFREEEVFVQRLVPRMEWGGHEITVEYTDLPADVGSTRRALYRPAGEPESKGPLRCLSLWLGAQGLGKMYVVNLPVSWLFKTELGSAAQRSSVEAEQPADFQPAPEVYLEAYGSHVVSEGGRLLAVLLCHEGESALGDAPEVTIERRDALLEPVHRAVGDYRAELVGGRRPRDLRIFLDRAAMEGQAQWLKRQRGGAEVRSGLLLGEVCVDPGGERFVDIQAILPVSDFGTKLEELSLRPDAWQKVCRQTRQRFPELRRIGWFRILEIDDPSKRTVRWLDWLRGGEYRGSIEGVEPMRLSDLQLQHSLFPEPWQVMMFLDARSAKPLFFQQADDSYEPCSGFYLYSRRS